MQLRRPRGSGSTAACQAKLRSQRPTAAFAGSVEHRAALPERRLLEGLLLGFATSASPTAAANVQTRFHCAVDQLRAARIRPDCGRPHLSCHRKAHQQIQGPEVPHGKALLAIHQLESFSSPSESAISTAYTGSRSGRLQNNTRL